MKQTAAEIIKKLSLISFTIERQTTDKDINTLRSPVSNADIATHLRSNGFPNIFSWNIKLEKGPLKEIGYYTIKVRLSNDPKEDGAIKLWILPAPNRVEARGKSDDIRFPYYIIPTYSSSFAYWRIDSTAGGIGFYLDGTTEACGYIKPDSAADLVSKEEAEARLKKPSFPKYYIQPNLLSTRKFYRVDKEYLCNSYNAVWVDSQGKEHSCYVRESDHKLLQEISKEKAMALIAKPSGFPKYLIPNFSSVVAYYRMDSVRSGVSFWKNGKETAVDWEPDSDLVKEVTVQEAVSKLNPKTPASAPKQGITIAEAVRQLESEGTGQYGYRLHFYSNTNAVRIIMGAYKKSTSCRRVSLRDALKWAKQKSAK